MNNHPLNVSLLAVAAGVSVVLFAASNARAAKVADGHPAETTLRGKLVEIEGKKPALVPSGTGPALDPPSEGTVMLAGRQQYLFATLKDKRVAGHQVALKGHMRPDGFFQVDDIHTVHNGKLYWVRYYCETCNISALGPGNCVCCQQPTELQEIPAGVPPGPNPKGVIITH